MFSAMLPDGTPYQADLFELIEDEGDPLEAVVNLLQRVIRVLPAESQAYVLQKLPNIITSQEVHA